MKKRLMIITAMGFVVFLIFGTVWGQKNPTLTLNLYEKRIAYLKEHEQEMTDYVKSENSKVESVQWDWDSLDVGVAGNGTPQGAGIYLDISGKFNDIEESKLTMTWQLKDEKSFPKISAMYLTDVSVVKNGGWVDYE